MSDFAQTGFSITTDPKHPEKKMLVGAITKEHLSTDTAFGWYAQSYRYYSPDSATVAAFKANQHCRFIVFGGTWCEDTQNILPKFFKLMEQANIPSEHLSLFAVDRDKKVFGNLTSAMQILNVPTFIVMKNGKEVGRVVEYGSTGNWDKELAGLLLSSN